MKRKNIIIVLLIICLVIIKYFTINYINNNSRSFDSKLPKMDENMGTPPDKTKEDTKTESNINPDENENSNNIELTEKKIIMECHQMGLIKVDFLTLII